MTKGIKSIGNDGIRSILSQINHLRKKTERTEAIGNKISKESTAKGYSEEIERLTKGLIIRIHATIRETKDPAESVRLKKIVSLLAKGETKIEV